MEPSCIFIVLVCPALLITQCQTHTIELNLQINFPNPFKKTHLDYSTPTNAQEFQGSSEDESNYPSHPQVDGRLKKVSTSEAEEQCKVVIDAEYTPKKLKNMAGLERAIVNHVGFLQYMASHSNGASFNQFEHYGSVHGHNHQHDEPFRRQNATKGSLSSLEGDAEGPVLDMVERDPNYPYREVRYFLRNNPLLRDYFVAAATPQIVTG
ncbi:hypothetical protein HUJ05_011432 [Dendroctonus ponderosae]|nr:hypothetical protein HUJ05_011432 [Dendroctonus ponderosae]